ncbi:FRG domain-containing protein [Propionicimonas paludicola]|uniref:FRG domain-containing protein n=1 Tax=Propionicimonas paludicola TaxID=185243 RepID=A0A2A9CQR7_9ACTN|nr:FRG domain-containing protein [Propionicimonas paludicola]PFG16688.1 FRG domain-containing protein [Propionicimonas paludicola]
MRPGTVLRDDATPLYRPYENVIETWDQLHREIDQFGDIFHSEQFVWRGQSNAVWGLWSSLYRELARQLGKVPTEEDLVESERQLLTLARTEWRLDGVPALSLFGQMQHVGVPTRLIDATTNPLIAAWFAVSDRPGADGRLFAFTAKSTLQLNSRWNGNTPRWHRRLDDPTLADWGLGGGSWIWQPPALHARIPAQSAVFLLDGVPTEAGHRFPRLQPGSSSTYTAAQTREFASIPIRFWQIRLRGEAPSKGTVFTYRITAAAKHSIRHQLEKRFGYSFATIYPDIEGLAQYVRNTPESLIRGAIDTRR